MASKYSPVHKDQQDNLQNFIDYSVQHYDGFGRILSRALKNPIPPKVKK